MATIETHVKNHALSVGAEDLPYDIQHILWVRSIHRTMEDINFELQLKESLDELYVECEHGDDEHRQWLKDKFEDFFVRKTTRPSLNNDGEKVY